MWRENESILKLNLSYCLKKKGLGQNQLMIHIMKRKSNFCVLTHWSELPLMSGTKISFCKFYLLRLPQLTWAKSHSLLRDEFIRDRNIHKRNGCRGSAMLRINVDLKDVDWPRGKGGLPLPTVRISAGSPSERKRGSGCALSISSLCFLTSATRPRSRTLLQRSAAWSRDIAITHFRHHRVSATNFCDH